MTTSDEQYFESIREEYRDLVLLVGLGFNPDTPHDGYEPPLLQITEAEYNRWIEHMFFIGVDEPYDEGLKVFETLQSATEEEQGHLRMEALDRIIARREAAKRPDPNLFAEYTADPDRDPEQLYSPWLWEQVNTQLDILQDSSRRLHHVLGPLQLAVLYAQELERISHEG